MCLVFSVHGVSWITTFFQVHGPRALKKMVFTENISNKPQQLVWQWSVSARRTVLLFGNKKLDGDGKNRNAQGMSNSMA